MPESEGAERTERATSKRRQEAREEGQVARSVELNTLLIFTAGLISINFFALVMLGHYWEMMRYALINCASIDVSVLNITNLIAFYLVKALAIVAPVFIVIIVAAILANVAQVGFMVSAKPMTPNFDRIDPVKGFKNMFSKHKVGDLVKGVLKIFIIGYTAFKTVINRIDRFPMLIDQSVREILLFIAYMIFKVMFNVILIYTVIALLDYAFQKWRYEEDIKMTKQEVKEELKQQEGDPLIKGRIRSVQRELARRRMMKEVERAEVVVTNPIHLAVALRYDMKKMDAPMVVAKGARLIAEKIKEIAKEHNVPIVEDKALAQTLYKNVEIDEFVPMELFKAVAEILAYVYRLSNKHVEPV